MMLLQRAVLVTPSHASVRYVSLLRDNSNTIASIFTSH